MRMNDNSISVKYCLYLILVFILGSCSPRNSMNLLKFPKSFNTDTLKTIIVANPTVNYQEYKIKAFDLISIRNLQDETLLGSRLGDAGLQLYNYKVNKDGEIILPVIGSIMVGGLNRQEAQNKIQQLYAASLFKNPIIELRINSLQVTLLGAFNAPGNLILDNEDYDLIDIIGKAGGVSDDANIKQIRIIRGNRSNPELILVNLANVNTLASPKLKLQDGDIIIAEDNKFSVFLKGVQNFNNISSIGLVLLNTYLIVRSLR